MILQTNLKLYFQESHVNNTNTEFILQLYINQSQNRLF